VTLVMDIEFPDEVYWDHSAESIVEFLDCFDNQVFPRKEIGVYLKHGAIFEDDFLSRLLYSFGQKAPSFHFANEVIFKIFKKKEDDINIKKQKITSERKVKGKGRRKAGEAPKVVVTEMMIAPLETFLVRTVTNEEAAKNIRLVMKNGSFGQPGKVTKTNKTNCKVLGGTKFELLNERLREYARAEDPKGKRKADDGEESIVRGKGKKAKYVADSDDDSDEEMI